jgi:hypothetical protein
MKSFLIQHNIPLDHLLKRIIGKKRSLVIARTIEKAILIFGREEAPGYTKSKMPAERS